MNVVERMLDRLWNLIRRRPWLSLAALTAFQTACTLQSRALCFRPFGKGGRGVEDESERGESEPPPTNFVPFFFSFAPGTSFESARPTSLSLCTRSSHTARVSNPSAPLRTHPRPTAR